MAVILCIETSTNVCSVSISSGEDIIFNKVELKGPSHAALLGVFTDEAIKYLREKNIKADAVAVSSGPGSYTGLRIGVSAAKGICYGLNIPLIAINTPLILASTIININKGELDDNTLLCSMIDARRMEVYAAIYDSKLNIVRDIQADIVDENFYNEFLDKQKIVFFGNGASKFKDTITHTNACFEDDINPLASEMIRLANKAFADNNFVDVAYFEPFYLKEFVATTPKNKII